MHNKKSVLLVGILMMTACSQEPKKVVATKQIDIYKQPIDGTNDVAFTVRTGDVCAFIDEQQNKVYLYKKVNCNGQIGWTPDWADFRPQ